MDLMGQCANCGAHAVDIMSNPLTDGFHITAALKAEYIICSPSCLVEWAWKRKDAQVKLSKSKGA